MAPGAKTKFEVAVLFFTAAAAVTGFLGLIVSWLSYRLEAGRVPKPDLAIVSDVDAACRFHEPTSSRLLRRAVTMVGTRIEFEHGNIVRVARPRTGQAMKRRDRDARV